jgi:hypothetical protein
VQAPKPPPSSLHWKVDPPSSAENVKVASALVDGSLGLESIVVSGGVESYVNVRLGPASVFPAASCARTWTV